MRNVIALVLLFSGLGYSYAQTLDIEASSNFTLGPPYKAIGEIGASFRYNHFSLGLIYTLPKEQNHWRINFLGVKSKLFFLDQSKKFNVYVENSSSFQIGSVHDRFWIDNFYQIRKSISSENSWYVGELQKVNYLGYFGAGMMVKLTPSFNVGLAFGFTRYSWTYSILPYSAPSSAEKEIRTESFWTGGPVVHLTYSIPVGKKKE